MDERFKIDERFADSDEEKNQTPSDELTKQCTSAVDGKQVVYCFRRSPRLAGKILRRFITR